MSKPDFDVVILGGGSGGLAAAFRAASYGAKVALLEPIALGGTCVNVGCVPKKAMWLAADLAERLHLAGELGFAVPVHAMALDWSQLLQRRQQYIANIHASYRQRLADNAIEHISQRGCLLDSHTVQCADGRLLCAQHIVIATGSHPVKPAIAGAELGGVSDDFFALQTAPNKVAIIGGGYIAVELASVLNALGSRVSLLVRGPRLLRGFDAELTNQLAQNLRQQGITLHLECGVRALEASGEYISLQTNLPSSDLINSSFDSVLFATGPLQCLAFLLWVMSPEKPC